MTVRHPAKYSNVLIPVMARYLIGCHRVFDCFGGTGKIAAIREHGFSGEIWASDLEAEWIAQGVGRCDVVATWDARAVPLPDGWFQGICTSVAYGNRMADTYVDHSRRNTYTAALGRELSEGSTANKQWTDPEYRRLHLMAWMEMIRLLAPGGVLVLNCSDHIRKGERQYVTAWHVSILMELGLRLVDWEAVVTPRQRHGANGNLRVACEDIVVLRKVA